MLSTRDSDILEAVYTFHYLTVPQLTRLIYGTKSDHFTNEQVKRLTEAGYLYRFPLPDSKRGNKQLIATLDSKGIKHLKETGKDGLYFRPGDTPPSILHLQHELAVNDFLISASLLPKCEPAITLHGLKTGWQLSHTPLKVSVRGEKISVVGDGFLDFRYLVGNDTYQTAVWLELDRNSEYSKQLKRKVRGLVTALMSKHAADLFGTDLFTIAFVTMSDARLQAIRTYVMEVLTEMERMQYASMFLFTSLSQEVEPNIFISPMWQTLNGITPVPLLDLS